jgi:hypothetical protein
MSRTHYSPLLYSFGTLAATTDNGRSMVISLITRDPGSAMMGSIARKDELQRLAIEKNNHSTA